MLAVLVMLPFMLVGYATSNTQDKIIATGKPSRMVVTSTCRTQSGALQIGKMAEETSIKSQPIAA